jgi:hypothetical protein
VSYYTDCVEVACAGLPTNRTGIWPFRADSEHEKCMNRCEIAGKFEKQETQFEQDFHRSGDIDFNADVDVDVNAKAELYKGMKDAEDTYITNAGQPYIGASQSSDQGDDLGPLLFAGLAAMGLMVVLKL